MVLVTGVREKEAELADRTRAETEARRRQEEQRKALVARKKKSPTRMASRGVTNGAFANRDYVTIYADAVRYFNPYLEVAQSRRIAAAIIDNSRNHGLDARLVMAVIAVESRFNQNAVSRVGAMGLGQLMPGTANGLGVANAFDVHQNLEGSTRLLRSHIQNMSAQGLPTPEALKLALACYNAGAGAVKKYRGIPPYRETQDYVRRITRLYFQMLPAREKDAWLQRGWQPG